MTKYNETGTRYCQRPACGAELHNEPHLCADIAKRLKRRQAQVTAVCDLLWEFGLYSADNTPVAEAIVQRLSAMGVTDDT